ncbi:MAG: hypothetical protein RBT63_09545, partial [Bdellovibrionales bacterium]|nr:hypothetical protein [Bdellovibrionales bacterium]
RNAQFIQTGARIGLPNEVDVEARVASFFIEDDVSPGFYNSSHLGHGNRQGIAGGLEAFFNKQRFKVYANFVDADVINRKLNQSRQQTFTIGFETFYEML